MNTLIYYLIKVTLKLTEVGLRFLSKKVTLEGLETLCPPLKKGSSLSENSLGQKSFHVGIVVPYRDNFVMTERCLSYLKKLNLPPHLKATLILADNGSSQKETQEGIAKIMTLEFPMPILKCILDYPFNYSKINNDAVYFASKELEKNHGTPLTHLWFLNNDVMVIDPNALQKLSSACNLPNCGAVGNTLLYPNQKIQHLYAEPFVKIIASHPFKNDILPHDSSWLNSPRSVPAVTGASLFISVEAFEASGRFDERLPTLGQDIDLCLTLREAGKVIVVLPGLILIHEESSTKKAVFPISEVEYFYNKWDHSTLLNSRPVLKWSEKLYLSSLSWKYPVTLYVHGKRNANR